jgi:C4-dicarboxylate transporter, DctM subunit
MFVLIFIVLMALAMPIAFAMGITCLYHFTFIGHLPIESFMNMLYAGVNNFTLMAIPFFILAGTLMNEGGVTVRLVNLARALVGHIRGGLGHVNVVTSMFFAGISGAAVADAAAVGSLLIQPMVDDGYDRDIATAITVAGSTIGPMIPPSIPMVVYSITAGTSIGGMFLAGAVPGIIMGFMLMIYIAYMARKRNFRVNRKFSFRALGLAFKEGVWALMMPFIILGGIFSGIFTATEAAVVAVVYAVIIGLFVTKELKIKRLPRVLCDTALTTSIVMIIIGMATVFGRVLTIEHIPTALAEYFMNVSDNRVVLLLLLNVLLLIVGCFLELSAAVVLLVPSLLPLATQLGIDPLQFGSIIVINLIIGFITPPVGVCLYVGVTVGKVSFEQLVRVIWPFVVIGIALCFLVTFVPAITLWLPHLFL